MSPHAAYTVCGLVDGDCEAVLSADVCSRQTCGPSADDADGLLLDRGIHGQDGVGNSGQQCLNRGYSESRPALMRVPLMVWNCVFPCWVGVSKGPGHAAGVLGRRTEIRYRMWPRSVTERCWSNSERAKRRMSRRAPASGMLAVLRTMSRHRARARWRWMNCRTVSGRGAGPDASWDRYVVQAHGSFSSCAQAGGRLGGDGRVGAQHGGAMCRGRVPVPKVGGWRWAVGG